LPELRQKAEDREIMTMYGSVARGRGVGLIMAALLMVASAGQASAQSIFDTLAGTWNGSGQIKLDNGKSEALKCRAYYTQKDGSSELGLAIRCASASNKIELRATLSQTSGQVAGMWEERTFNASGTVTGKASPGRINLTITGGSFQGSMNVSVAGSRHTVLIETNGTIGLRAVNINLSRG
jgi:hypothetical protein